MSVPNPFRSSLPQSSDRINQLKDDISNYDAAAFGGRDPQVLATSSVVIKHSPSKFNQSRMVDSPSRGSERGPAGAMSMSEDEVRLTNTQEHQLKTALEGSLKQGNDMMDRMRDNIKLLSVDIHDKRLRKDQLTKLFSERTEEVKNMETKLKKDIHETKEKLETTMIYRKRESYGYKQEKEKLIIRIKRQKQAIETLSKEKEDLENQHENIKTEAGQAHTQKMAKFKASMQPLEEAEKQIENHKQQIHEKLEYATSVRNMYENQLNMLIEDLNSLNIEDEILEERQTYLENSFEEFKVEFKEELELFRQDLDNQAQLRRTLKDKEELEQKCKKNEDARIWEQGELNHLEEDTNTLKEELTKLKKPYEKVIKEDVKEIEKLESFLNAKANELNAPTIAEITNELLLIHNFNFNKEVLIVQISQIEKEQVHLMVEENKEKELAESQLQKLESEIREAKLILDDLASVTGTKNQSQLADENRATKNLNIKHRQFKLMRGRMENNALRNKARMEVLEKWKIRMKAHIQQEDQSLGGLERGKGKGELHTIFNSDIDHDVLAELMKKVICHIEDPEEKKTYEQMLSLYLVKLKERETEIQRIMAKEYNLRLNLNKKTEEVKHVESKLENLEEENSVLRGHLMSLSVNEKALQQIITEEQAELQFGLMKQSEDQFQEYLKQHHHIFMGVKKTYGVRIMDKMKDEHKKEFSTMIVAQQKERRQRIESMYIELRHIGEELSNHRIVKKDKLSMWVRDVEKQEMEGESRVKTLTNQLKVVIEAEAELTEQIESLLHRKKEEMQSAVQTLYRKRNAEQKVKRMDELSQGLIHKQGIITSQEQELTKLEKAAYEKATVYSIQKTQMTMRLEALAKQLMEVIRVVRPQLNTLEAEIRDFQYMITNDTKKVTILNERLTNSITNYELARQVLADKFKDAGELYSPSKTKLDYERGEEAIQDTIKLEDLQAMLRAEDRQSPEGNTSGNPIVLEESKEEAGEAYGEPSITPKYGRININIADLNETTESEKRERDREVGMAAEIQTPPKNTFSYSNFNEKKSLYRLNLENLPLKEIQLFDSVKPLMEGIPIYKKLSAQNLLNQKNFDPLNAEKCPPEKCGYGARMVKFHKSLCKLEFKQLNKAWIESNLGVSVIKRTVVPNATMQIAKIQKQGMTSVEKEVGGAALYGGNKDLEKRQGNVEAAHISAANLFEVKDWEVVKSKCMDVEYYPFCILTNDGRIELIATTYNTFKYLTNGITQMVKNAALLPKLAKKIEDLKPTPDDDE